MPARINNLPANSVYDQTPTATITTAYTNNSASPVNTITGTTASTRDLDLTSYYGYDSTGSANPHTSTFYIKYDFHKVIWNVLIWCKVELGNGTTAVEVSSDNTNWTLLDDTISSVETNTYSVFACRYLRFTATRTDAINAVKIYEVKIQGS